MTVRAWFRLRRRTAWERNEFPEVTLFCRAESPNPLGPGVRLCDLIDYQTLIEHPEKVVPPFVLVQRDMQKYL